MRTLVAAAGAFLTLTGPAVASAQAADTDQPADRNDQARSGGLAEVIVTAQKRAQNLQDIPTSISAVGEQRIENLGLQNINDIMRTVPGVTFTSVGAGKGNLVIRGISTGMAESFSNNVKETVGVYINETPVAMARFNLDISPFDLERVEVLRGPQGTLYGSGSLSGTVRYITRKPDTSGFAAKVGSDISATEHGGINHRINAMLNVPLSETFAIRAVGYQQFNDGFIDGVGPGYLGKRQNDWGKYGGRVAAKWTPNGRFTADASVIVERLHSRMNSYDNENFAFAASQGAQVGPLQQWSGASEFSKQDAHLYNLTLNYDLGWADLTSSSSYLHRQLSGATDFTFTFFEFFGTTLPAASSIVDKYGDFSQELRIATTFAGPLKFIGGVFYIDQTKKQFEPTLAPGFDAAYLIPVVGVDSTFFGTPPDTPYVQNARRADRQVALFGDLTYAMTDKWSTTAGLRWFDVKQDYFIESKGFVASGNPPFDRSSAERGINPKFMLSYAWSEDILLSAQAARGFRLGGANDFVSPLLCKAELAARGLAAAPESFKSESIWNYEINAKTAWADHRLIANGSAYYIDYKDIQVTTALNCGFPFTANAASAKSKGAELELIAAPLEGLQINLGAAYADAELAANVPDLNGRKGDALPFSAKFTFNTTIRYEAPLSEKLHGFVQYNYLHSDDVVFKLGWRGNAATVAQPGGGYNLHGVRLGLNRDRWDAALYVDNLFDQDVITFEDVIPGERSRYHGMPRTFGLNVSASF